MGRKLIQGNGGIGVGKGVLARTQVQVGMRVLIERKLVSDIEVRIKVPRICSADCKCTCEVEHCTASYSQDCTEFFFFFFQGMSLKTHHDSGAADIFSYLSASSRKLKLSNCQKMVQTLSKEDYEGI